MKVTVILRGYEEVAHVGSPAEVLPRVDEVIAGWKVMWYGEKTGKGR